MKNRFLAIPASILALLMMLISACGRQTNERDLQQNALQQATENQKKLAEQMKANQEKAAAAAKQAAEKQQKVRQDVVDEQFRHGKVVLAGPMVKAESAKTTDPVASGYKGVFFLELENGQVKGREVEDTQDPSRGRKRFSRSLSEVGRQRLQQLRQMQTNSVVSIGCGELVRIEEPQPGTNDEVGDVDLTKPESEQRATNPEPTGPIVIESPLLQKINSGLAEKKILVDGPIEDVDQRGEVKIVADTVIACSTYNKQIEIIARRLILSDFSMSLVESGTVTSFAAFAEDLYLLGDSRILSTSSGGMIWLEIARDFASRPAPFDTGKLNIVVQGKTLEK